MKHTKVFAQKEVSCDDLAKIEDIMKHSQCPNESLRKTFDRYHGMDSGTIHFDNWYSQSHIYDIEY